MNATPELKTKRRNLLRWQESRLRRLDAICKAGNATLRQRARRHELANAIMRGRYQQSAGRRTASKPAGKPQN